MATYTANVKEPHEANEKSVFRSEVIDYWDKRSGTYSNSVKDELGDVRFDAWSEALLSRICPRSAYAAPESLMVLDLGCGPGFFEIILSRSGCSVHAVDSSAQMIEQARANVSLSGNPALVEFHCCDVAELPFDASVFDVVVSRNVTWLMPDPLKAYSEWHRVLKPGGKMLVFDANWYSYLVDDQINQVRLGDQDDSSILAWSEQSFATSEQERRCEALALRLPLTYERRPEWDESVLPSLGFDEVRADKRFSELVWTKGEQSYYGTSPLFAIEAQKSCLARV